VHVQALSERASHVYQIRLVGKGQLGTLTPCFQASKAGETRNQFQKRVARVLAYPNTYECLIATDTADCPLALVVFDRTSPRLLELPVFRLTKHAIAPTMARHLLLKAVSVSASEGRTITSITDPFLGDTTVQALLENSFVDLHAKWIKINLPVKETASELATRLSELVPSSAEEYKCCLDLSRKMGEAGARHDLHALIKLERALWPAKVADAEIPAFIIPIEPQWAEQLFDEELAAQTLFAAPPRLGLNREAVYYRSSAAAGGLSAPARILWYVSQGKKYQGSMQLRACSYTDEVFVGKPKDLYRQYRRLGVYVWHNVFDLAKRDLNRTIMAIRFRDTELFPSPVSWQAFQEILREQGRPSRIQSPHPIPSNVFLQLYGMGTGR